MKMKKLTHLAMLLFCLGCSASERVHVAQIVKVERSSEWEHLSTFDGSLIRRDQDTSSIEFTTAEQNRVSYICDSVQFWSLPIELRAVYGTNKTPNSGQNIIRIQTPAHDKTLRWSDAESDGYAADGDRLFRVIAVIDSILLTRPPVRAGHRGPWLM